VEFSRAGGYQTVYGGLRSFRISYLRLARRLHPQGTEVLKAMKKLMILVAAAAMAMAPMASAARVMFVGGPVWGPGFYGPYGGPAYWGPAYASVLGEVKIDTKAKDDEVFINGAFAGVTKDMKSFRLREGTYTIEVRHAGQAQVNEKVFVAAGKTVHLHPAL